MARRYVFTAVANLASTIRGQVPSATVTESGGWIEVIVPEAAVDVFDAALPASPMVAEPVADATPPALSRAVRADLYDGLPALIAQARTRLGAGTLAQTRADLGALLSALDGIVADAAARPIDPISRTGP